MKRKLISLALAAALLLSAAGCAMTTPASVGSIGGVEIPAGLYLLMQYNAYSVAASGAELPEGKTTSDVAAVLAAQTTGEIGGEEVTTGGADFIDRLTRSDLGYYAAVELTFDELGGIIDDATAQAAADNVESIWSSNGELYAANGIGQAAMEAYLINVQKEEQLLELLYGDNGRDPVTTKEYTDFIQNEAVYIQSLQVPLIDYSTFTIADEDQTAAIMDLAEETADKLNEIASEEMVDTLGIGAVLNAVGADFLPRAFEAMGQTFDTANTAAYIASELVLPGELDGFEDEDGNNTVLDPLRDADGEWVALNLGSSIMVARLADALQYNELEDLLENNSVLTALKSDDLQAELRDRAAELDWALDENAMKVYKAANIKRSV